MCVGVFQSEKTRNFYNMYIILYSLVPWRWSPLIDIITYLNWYSFAISLNYCFVLEHYISIIFVTYYGSVLDPSFWFLSMIMYKCLSELYVKGMCLCCILIHTPSSNTAHQKVTQVTGQRKQKINSNTFIYVHWYDFDASMAKL